ncbi:MAG: GTP 3',8-cyclase MoaA [Bacteroidota bacterium]
MPVSPIIDNHGRPIEYVRLAVTDRCNLRCFYCMPEEGIQYMKRKALLSFEEMERLLRILGSMGVSKVRITGGEPFLRKNLIQFLEKMVEIPGIEQWNLTTNGVLTEAYIPQLLSLGIQAVNLSLDTLDKNRFHQITRRDELEKVIQCMHALLAAGITTKVNAVVMAGKNTEDIVPMVRLTQDLPLEMRFIEEMPFNGSASTTPHSTWSARQILDQIQEVFPNIHPLPSPPHSTAKKYQIPGFQGQIGIIAAFSRTFCGSCNRIRLTPQGTLKTCLYDDGVLNLRDLMREGANDETIQLELRKAFGQRAKDGWEAERNRKGSDNISESMATIGG